MKNDEKPIRDKNKLLRTHSQAPLTNSRKNLRQNGGQGEKVGTPNNPRPAKF